MNAFYEIGPFRLDCRVLALTRRGARIPLGPRAVAVLSILVENAPHYVSKDQILEAAWPGLVVEQGNLSVQISAIRRELARHGGSETWIETLSRRGYRFTGPVIAKSATSAIRTTEAASTLPSNPASFIGRSAELDAVRKMLRQHRLVTIVGAGGIGKTRLALEIAREVEGDYGNGARFADLAVAADLAGVCNRIAAALGLPDVTPSTLLDVVRRRSASTSLLLVIDNCEHVADVCGNLVKALLQTIDGLVVLATSRQGLRVEDEAVFYLSALAVPDRHADADRILDADSTRLFLARARSVSPGFCRDEKDVVAVASICRRLDGIPLALEMAAARAPIVGLGSLATKLEEHFRLLTLGWRTTLPRHLTVRAVLDWSYQQLHETERTVFRRVAVCCGGFTLSAAQAIAADEAIDPFEVGDLLCQLAAKSMLIVDEPPQHDVRYRMLETMRIYALERLAEATETGTVIARHTDYYRTVFADAYGTWRRTADHVWRDKYGPEVENVRAILDRQPDDEQARNLQARLAADSVPMWYELSARAEGRERLTAILARAGRGLDPRVTAQLNLELGWFLVDSNASATIEHAVQAVNAYRAADETEQLGDALSLLGHAKARIGDLSAAEAALLEARALLRLFAPSKALGRAVCGLGLAREMQKRFSEAQLLYQEAGELFADAGGERQSVAMAGILAELSWIAGDLDEAIAAFRRAIDLISSSPGETKIGLSFALCGLSAALTERGECAEALTMARAGLPTLRDAGIAWKYYDHMALRAALVGKHHEAARILGYTEKMYEARGILRAPHHSRAEQRVMSLLKERLDEKSVEKLGRAGATLDEDAIFALVLSQGLDAHPTFDEDETAQKVRQVE